MTTRRSRMRLGVLAVAALWPFVIDASGALRPATHVVALTLVGFSLTVTVGWLRVLALHTPMMAAVGAMSATAVLGAGQGVPLALVVALTAGALAGLLPVLLVLDDPREGLPVASLIATAAMWALALPLYRTGSFARPVIVGIDLAADRPLYLAVLGLLAAAWYALDNVDGADLGRRLRTLGSDATLLARSGVDMAALWLVGCALAGSLAALGGFALALTWQGLPETTTFSPAFSIVLLVMPLLAGTRNPAGAAVGAALLVVIPLMAIAPAADVLVGAALVAALALAGGGGLPGLVRWWRQA